MSEELSTAERRAVIGQLMVLSAGTRDATAIPELPPGPRLVELARLHCKFHFGGSMSVSAWVAWLGMGTAMRYRAHLEAQTAELVELAREVLDSVDAGALMALRESPAWTAWRAADAHHASTGKVGRPLAECPTAASGNATLLEELRVEAGLSGAAWARHFGMSFNTYLNKVEMGMVDDAWVAVARDVTAKMLAEAVTTEAVPARAHGVTEEELWRRVDAEWVVYQASLAAPAYPSPGAVVPIPELTEEASEEIDAE